MNAPFWKILDNPVGADFTLRAELTGGSFPAETTSTMELLEADGATLITTLEGTYSETGFDFTYPLADSDALPDRVPYRIHVNYPDPARTYLWYYGLLRRVGGHPTIDGS
jgi:hypothetical protein